MIENTHFKAIRFLTQEEIDIPINKIMEIIGRSSTPGEKVDHARVFIDGIDTELGRQPHPLLNEEGLLLIDLESFEKRKELKQK